MLMLRKFNNEGNLKQLFSFEFQVKKDCTISGLYILYSLFGTSYF
uniref:Uncharacterized protein n=1 Tax=Lepeophtheirus salmonis TaxID=72036 RepID=A0A0K2UN90_LEPSM